MSVAVCRSSVASGFESILALPAAFSASSNWLYSSPVAPKNPQTQTEAERSPGEVDIWASIQDQKAQQEPIEKEEPYVHPLMRRPSSLLSKKSLEICTENLGSESGSDDYFSFSDEESNFFTNSKQTAVEEEQEGLAHKEKRMRSNYRCCSMSRASELRRFPPPLPSISRRDGPCLKMRPLRRDGRLVVEAVAVPSQNYLQAQRHNGRLLLSFINTTTTTSHNSSFDDAIERNNATAGIINEEEAQYDTEEEEEEEEVQVVDRGTVVEVNVSTKPPQQNRKKVHRSSIVINKFVSFAPTINNEDNYAAPAAAAARPSARRSSATATTAAAAAVAASSLSASSAGDVADLSAAAESKLMLTRRRNGEELLIDMRRCGQLRRPLFFRETCCIATSS